jgi:hypothetical protein
MGSLAVGISTFGNIKKQKNKKQNKIFYRAKTADV